MTNLQAIDKLAQCTGQTDLTVMDWITADASPSRDDYFKIVAHYYEYFPTGIGADTVVVCAPADDPASPDYIQLGHEMIHAWRMMTGRRIVGTNMWEEEAMTVGLSPFANLRFTENALRRDAKLPARLKYGGSVTASTDYISNFQNQVEGSLRIYDKKYRKPWK